MGLGCCFNISQHGDKWNSGTLVDILVDGKILYWLVLHNRKSYILNNGIVFFLFLFI